MTGYPRILNCCYGVRDFADPARLIDLARQAVDRGVTARAEVVASLDRLERVLERPRVSADDLAVAERAVIDAWRAELPEIARSL